MIPKVSKSLVKSGVWIYIPSTLFADSDMGGWSQWSEWTSCSSTCTGGTRSRHRFCDSPPPRYGAKFCEVGAYFKFKYAK